MPQFNVGDKVRVLVNIDNTWQTENVVAVVHRLDHGMVKVRCLGGMFEPIRADDPPERTLWIGARQLKLVNRMPISPLFLQEVDI